jgi:hypothetical protein
MEENYKKFKKKLDTNYFSTLINKVGTYCIFAHNLIILPAPSFRLGRKMNKARIPHTKPSAMRKNGIREINGI